MKHRSIVLASSSPRRLELLLQAGLEVEVAAPHVNEDVLAGEDPRDYVLRLAAAKAEAVRAAHPGRVLVAADTAVVLGDEVLGKPASVAEASAMLWRLQGRVHRVITGFCVCLDHERRIDAVETSVRFRTLGAEDIERYVRTGEPMDKAGAYGIQGLGAAAVDRVEGSYTNVVGLPLREVLERIAELGGRT